MINVTGLSGPSQRVVVVEQRRPSFLWCGSPSHHLTPAHLGQSARVKARPSVTTCTTNTWVHSKSTINFLLAKGGTHVSCFSRLVGGVEGCGINEQLLVKIFWGHKTAGEYGGVDRRNVFPQECYGSRTTSLILSYSIRAPINDSK